MHQTFGDHVTPLGSSGRILPRGLVDAVKFIALRPLIEIRGFREKEMSKPRGMAAAIQPDRGVSWHQLTGGQLETRDRLHIPHLRDVLGEFGMGDGAWVGQLVNGAGVPRPTGWYAAYLWYADQ